MDNWEKFDGTTLPPKESFYCKLNLEGISDADYVHAQKVWEVFWIKNRGEYHDLNAKIIKYYCLQMYLKILETCALKYMNLILYIFVSAPGLACLLKKDRIKIRIMNRLWHAIDGWKDD